MKKGEVSMKNLIIAAMIIVGATTYTRDFEYREKLTHKIKKYNLERGGRVTCHIWDLQKENDNDFILELKKQDRGHEKR